MQEVEFTTKVFGKFMKLSSLYLNNSYSYANKICQCCWYLNNNHKYVKPFLCVKVTHYTTIYFCVDRQFFLHF